MHRETSPLKQAKDAVLVDSSEMNIDEVVDAIYQIYARVYENMNVILAKSAGFCFGVKRAVDMVYERILEKEPLYTFGPIIHNEEVVR